MATTKLMHMKAAPKGSAGSHLKNAINYILQDKKVAKDDVGIQYKTAQGCFIDHAYEAMIQTKKRYGKTDGRQGYHFVISFEPGTATKEQLWEITQGFIKEYLPGYEVVSAIHDDRPHLHSHIIFNSVNYDTGLKYHYKNGDWEAIIQPIIDRLCLEVGAPTLQYHIDEYDEDGVKKEQYYYSKTFNWTKEIKSDIDACIENAYSWEDVVEQMKAKGYTFNYGKYVSVHKPGMQRARRLKESTVGLAYTPEGIIERIMIKNQDYRTKSVGVVIWSNARMPGVYDGKRKFKRYADMRFDEKVMVKHMLRIRNAIPDYQMTPGNWYVNRKLAELHRTERKLFLINKYNIHGVSDIQNAITDITEEIKKLRQKSKMNEVRLEELQKLKGANDNEVPDIGTVTEGTDEIPALESNLIKNNEIISDEIKKLKECKRTLQTMKKEAELKEVRKQRIDEQRKKETDTRNEEREQRRSENTWQKR